ncbi:extracellular solute-binding protein [Actinotalea solisilvae]|uniref:extracellular solute-binding protein n=1 Tax=Actinotalea solisilvae TaxID=2072922 RepID=UPI0018F1A1EE|nr:extracellular solute-binding protein [Actinotalea solisilvae]
MRPSVPARLRVLAAATSLAAVGALAACGDAAPEEESGPALTIYSGRNENLVGPLLEQLEAAVGVPVEVRYAGSSELAAQLLEEGEGTDADLFFSQDAGALGALKNADMLADLPAAVLDRVPEQYRDADGTWVATSARARVLAYDPAQAPEVTSFTGIDQVLDEAYRGKIGFAPTNASFHAFVTALRLDRGEDGARRWLEDFAALDPQAYDNNIAVLDAVDEGQVALGLINHYYWYEQVAEEGADAVPSRLHFLASDDPGALINVAGVGVLAGSDMADEAQAAAEFLVSDEAQQYFADVTAEYPVVEGITSTEHDLQPLSELSGYVVDLNALESLEQTLALLDEVGLT